MTKADIIRITTELQKACRPTIGSKFENKIRMEISVNLARIAETLITEIEKEVSKCLRTRK